MGSDIQGRKRKIINLHVNLHEKELWQTLINVTC